MKNLPFLIAPVLLFTLVMLLIPGIPGQRLGDYRDPAMLYEEGWQELFNGKDLSGWLPVLKMEDGKSKKYREDEIDQQSTFFVEDGMLKTTGEPLGYLRTQAVYDNYVFYLEFRFDRIGNSGVTIHVQKDWVWPRGIECQLYQSHMGRVFPIRGATLKGGELIHDASKPPGEWNTFEVHSEEGRVATVLNGKLVALASDADPQIGYICLESEGVPTQFRNIRIKRYTPTHHLRDAPGPDQL
jgi:hypothetical protein